MKQPLIRLPFYWLMRIELRRRSTVSAKEYEKLQDVIVDWEVVQAMKNDHTMNVVMAIPTSVSGMFSVTFLSREDRDLPPWIVDRKAA
jgi:hypothetical protein